MIPLAHQLFENRSIDNEDSSHYISQLSPYMLPYHSKIPSTWSFLYKSLTEFSAIDELIFRDGIISLLKFFRNHPEPLNVSTKFYISKSLLPFVPKKWQPNIFGDCSKNGNEND